MTVDLVVERLRAVTPAGMARVAAEVLLRPAADLARDRRVLIVRRLRVDAADPAAARLKLVRLMERAVPGSDPTAPEAAAVVFDDLVDALMVITRDLAEGVAGDRWYWTSWLRRARSYGGSPLYGVWREHHAWLPAALRELATTSPEVVERAIGLLDDPEREVLGRLLPASALASERRSSRHEPSPAEPAVGHPADRRRPPPAAPYPHPGSGRRRRTQAGQAKSRPARPVRVVRQSPIPAPAQQPDRRAARTAPAGAAIRRAKHGRIAGFTPRPVDRARVGRAARPVPARRRPWHRSLANLVPPVRTGRPRVVPVRRPLAPARRSTDQFPVAAVPNPTTWSDGIATNHASALYLLHLVLRLGGEEAGYADLARFALWLLRHQPRRPRRLRDPLWPLLIALDEEPAAVPRGRPVWWRQAAAYLDDAGLDLDSFEQPGLVAVTRTHLDVVLGLDQIDFAVRMAGLDQDPGWVPQLGRVISFHFESS